MGNKKMERGRGIANLIHKLLRRVQNDTFGVSFTLKAARIKILWSIIASCLPESNHYSKGVTGE